MRRCKDELLKVLTYSQREEKYELGEKMADLSMKKLHPIKRSVSVENKMRSEFRHLSQKKEVEFLFVSF